VLSADVERRAPYPAALLTSNFTSLTQTSTFFSHFSVEKNSDIHCYALSVEDCRLYKTDSIG
jgi:hypothetical protein